MALNQAQLGGLYQQLYNRPLGQADIQALGGAGGPWSQMTPDQFMQQVAFPSQEFQSKYPGVNTIGGFQQAQAQTQAKNVFGPLVQEGQAANQQQFDALKKTIGLQKDQAEEGVRTALASRGILDTSKYGSDIAQIENTAQTQLGSAAQTLAQADQTLQQWAQSNIYGQASQQQQTNFDQQQAAELQAFNMSMATHKQLLADAGIDLSSTKTVSDIIGTFLNSGIDIATQYPEVWQSVIEAANKAGGVQSFQAQGQ